MYLFDFIKNIFKRGNIGILIYLLLNTFIIVAVLSGGFSSWQGILFGIGAYVLSLVVALSPIGEWILRRQTGCRKIKDQQVLSRLEPLFREVYEKAKITTPELHGRIKMFMSDDKEPNAFATGRRTVCVTRGLLNYSDEQIKGVLAHEFGHLAHKDTDAILVVSVGNMIITAIFFLMRVFSDIMFFIAQFISALSNSTAVNIFGFIFGVIGRFMARIFLAFLMWVWTKLGVLLCMYSSRKNEYAADEYSHNLGYGNGLKQVLISFGYSKSSGLFASLASSHPATQKRVAKLEELQRGYINA
jgi:heat shock protein HtpX